MKAWLLRTTAMWFLDWRWRDDPFTPQWRLEPWKGME